MARRRGLGLGLPRTCLKERIVARVLRGDDLAVDERDMQTVMELLWEIRDEVRAIRDLLEEDDDGEEEAGEEDT